MTISSITNDILDKILLEFARNDNINKIERNLVEPLIKYTFKRLYPYILISSVISTLTLILALIILLFIIRGTKYYI